MTDLKSKTVEELRKYAMVLPQWGGLGHAIEAFDEMKRRLEEAQQKNKEHDAEVAAKALEELWDSGRELQTDSYATGHPQAGMARLIGDHVHVEVTDGSSSWHGKIPLPTNWNK